MSEDVWIIDLSLRVRLDFCEVRVVFTFLRLLHLKKRHILTFHVRKLYQYKEGNQTKALQVAAIKLALSHYLLGWFLATSGRLRRGTAVRDGNLMPDPDTRDTPARSRPGICVSRALTCLV